MITRTFLLILIQLLTDGFYDILMIYEVKEKNIKKLKTYLKSDSKTNSNTNSKTERAAILFYKEICKKYKK